MLLELLLLKLFAGVVDWRGKEAVLEVAVLGEEEVAAVMGNKVGLLREGGMKATAGYGGVEGESVWLGGDDGLKRTHVPGGCELREAEEATANGADLL